uniref:Uncharacterized protein n=1 Tax=Moniliophthora roreri TaxID=221103 RepID=A0A0W0G3C7_MONRR
MSQPRTHSQDQPVNVNVNNPVLLDAGSNVHAHIEDSIKLPVYTSGRSTVAIMNAGAGSGMSSLSSVPIFDGERNKFKEFKCLFLGYCELQNVVEGLTQKKLSDEDKKDKDKLASWNEYNNKPAQGYQAFQKWNNRPFRPHGGNQSSGNQTYRHPNSGNQSSAGYKQGGNSSQHKSTDQKKKSSNQKSNQTKKSYKGKKQNTFVAAFDEGEEAINMAFATAIDEEGGTSDEAEDSEMEAQVEYSDQYSQTSEEEDMPHVETLSLASGRRSSAPLRQQSIAYKTDDGELISEQEVEDPFHSDDRLSSSITGNNNDEESLGEEDTDDEDDELESSDESFYTVPQGDEDKENTPPELVEAITLPMNLTSYFPQSNPPSHLETKVYCGSGPITLVPSFPDPSVPNNFNLHALRGHYSIPLTHSTPHIIVPNPLFTWINSLDEFLAQFLDKFVTLGMIKMQYIINRAKQEGLLDKPCIQTYLEIMYLAVRKPMHKIKPWSQYLGMGVYAVLWEKSDGARYWTYCTPPEYFFNEIPQLVDALLHVLGIDEPFMTDELILMELHRHPEAKCLSTCPICSNHLCQGEYHGQGLYYLGQTVVNDGDEILVPLPIIGNPVDLTIVYKDRIPEFYTELPEPAKPFLDS